MGHSTQNTIKNPFVKVLFFSFVFFSVLLFSCDDEYYYGNPGEAYLGLTWIDDEPDYLDAGTSAIPPVFKWNKYYRAYPGTYLFYYDGSIWTGHRWEDYAWEVEYTIWEYAGHAGAPGYPGADGPDNYFTIECSPWGPYVYQDAEWRKSDENPVISKSDDSIVTYKEGDDWKMKITYKKVMKKVDRKVESETKAIN